jgi:NTP pyrophosphatase (non-canonical NTP hydrolase)
VKIAVVVFLVLIGYLAIVVVIAMCLRLLNMDQPSPPLGRREPLPLRLPSDPGDSYYEGFESVSDDEQQECPEDPRRLEGQPIGMYHCPSCGCMVIAGMDHGPHDDGCWLGLDGGSLALRDLQAEVRAWQRRPYETSDPGPHPIVKAMKLAEEAGEVCGAVLKHHEHRKSMRDIEDEAGDVLIALCGLADAAGFDLATAVKRRWRGDVQWRDPRAIGSIVQPSEPAQDAKSGSDPGVPPTGLDVVEG